VDSRVRQRELKKKSEKHQKNIASVTPVTEAFLFIMWPIKALKAEPFNECGVFRVMKKILLIIVFSLQCSSCAIIVSNAASGFSDNLSKAVLNQDDPDLVRDGVPTLLLTMDSLIEGSPDSPQLLAAGATLYATYGAAFVDDPSRAHRLTARARR
jgi:hypothetical protein